MKDCITCKKLLELDCFHKDKRRKDGHRSECKECASARCRKWCRENKEKYRECLRKWYRKNREKKHAAAREWYRANKERASATAREYRQANPEKRKAQQAVNDAIRAGKLYKGPCIFCGTKENVDGHHDNYSKLLDVIWMCRKHHREFHMHKRDLEREAREKNCVA